MKRFALITALVTLTAVLFMATAPAAEVLGMPLTCGDNDPPEPCWIATMGVGVFALGGGAGLIEIGIFGFGLFFATGQIAGGLMVVGQLAIGVVAFLGQVASGLIGVGQGAVGYIKITQVSDNTEGKAFFKWFTSELEDTLRLW